MATKDRTKPDEPVVDEPSPDMPPEAASPAASSLEATSSEANFSVVGSLHAEQFEAVGSVVGFASASGDASISASVSPVVHAKGNVNVRQTYTSAIIAGGDMEISQACAPVIVGRQLSVHQGGAVVALTGEAEVRNGFVGVLLSPNASISEDSRVLLSTKAALIIAGAILGGCTLVSVVMSLAARRTRGWRRNIHVPATPDFGALAKRLRHHNAK